MDINKDHISAVQVISGLKGYQVTSCLSMPVEGGNIQRALTELSQNKDLKSDSCIASIPDGDISFRNLHLPFREPKKIKQTLPFEMETQVPFPIEEMVIDFNIIDRSDQTEILAVSIKKSHVSSCLSMLKESGIEPEILDINPVPSALWLLDNYNTAGDFIFLDIGLKKNRMILLTDGRIALIRNHLCKGINNNGLTAGSNDNQSSPNISRDQFESCLKSLCESVLNTVHSFKWQLNREFRPEKVFITGTALLYTGTCQILKHHLGIPAERISIIEDRKIQKDYNIEKAWDPARMNNALALAMREVRKGRGFNLRKGEFSLKKNYLGPKKQFKRAVGLLLAVLIFLFVDLGMDYYSLKKRNETAENKIMEIYGQDFPSEKNVRYPIIQYEQKIKDLEKASALLPGINKGNKVLDLLKDISERIPEKFDIDVKNLVIDGETVRISGETDTFNTVDSLKNGLEPSDYFSSVTITSANLDRGGERVNFEIKLERIP